MAILNHGSTLRTADGGQSTTTIVTANNIGSYAPALNSTYYVGTTQNVFNRASAAQTLTGVSIDGNAATVTNGVYTTGTQTIGGAKTFSDGITVNTATYNTFNKPTTTNYQTVALFGSAGGGLFLTTDSAIIGVGAYYNAGWIATATSGRQIDFAGGTFNFTVFSGATVGGAANWGSVATLNSSGVFSATGDFRAPIFYDSNNTAYYVDPASTSNLNVLNAVSSTTLWVRSGSWAGDLTSNGFTREIGMQMTGGSEFVILSKSGQGYTLVDGSYYAYEGGGFYSSFNSSYGAIVGFSADSTTSVTFNCNVKAPIYYDSNDTNYYLDAAGTSRLNTTRIGNINLGSGTYLNTITPIGDTNINLSAPSGAFYFDRDPRMPGFYDSNNTAYYVDPASTGYSAYFAGAIQATKIGIEDGGIDCYMEITDANPTINGVGYGGEFIFYGDKSTAAAYLYYGGATVSNILQANGSLRSPIFYDSDDTTYYIDPANGGFNLRGGNSNRVTFNSGDNGIIVTNAEGISSNVRLGCAWGRPGIYNGSSITVGAETQIDFVIANAVKAYIDSSSNLFANGSVRSPIFYDSNNTAFYIDAASTSVLNRLTIDGGNYAFDYFQSLSDFTSGTLVTTDIPATAAEGESFVMNVVGKSYSASASPFNFTVQGYLYYSTIINFSGIKLDSTGLTSVKIFENGGVLCFWWPTISYWNAFEVSVRAYNSAKNNYNRVTNITNSTEPVGTKKVTVTLQSFLRADVSATNSVDLRAPLFYDSNNTAYYLDPANTGTSLLVAGNVGIGTTSPGAKLAITADQSVYNNDTSQLIITGATSTSKRLILGYNTSTDKGFIQATNTAENYKDLLLNPNGGNVGIGTTSPNSKLEIYSTANEPAIRITSTATATKTFGLVVNPAWAVGSFHIYDYTLDNSRLQVASNGNVGIGVGANSPNSKVHIVSDSKILQLQPTTSTSQFYLAFSSDNWVSNRSLIGLDNSAGNNLWASGGSAYALSIGTIDSRNIVFATANNERVRIDSSGNVGIGTTSPSQKFHVSGIGYSDTDFRAPIFYDSDNTGYYLNPAGNSQVVSIYANDWFRAQGNTGLYFQDKGYGITSAGAASNSYGNASTYGTGLNGWQGWGIGSRHCFMSTGGDNIGIHDNTRSWLYYWNGTYHNFQYGYLQSDNSVRGPLFYDSNNTAYYLDPANTGTSLLVAGNVGIGTTSPGAKLHVAGAIGLYQTAGSTYLYYDHSGVNTWRTGIFTDNTSTYIIGHDNGGVFATKLFAITMGGNVGIGTTSPSWLLTAYATSAPQFVLQNATRSFILTNNSADNLLSFYYNSANRLQFNLTDQWFNTGNVGIGTTDFSYTINDNSRVVGSNTNNRLFVNGSIQLLGNNDAIVFGRGTSTFLTDEELGFGWGGGWYMTDETYLRVRNNKVLYTTGEIWGSIFKDSNNTAYYLDPAGNSRVSQITTDTGTGIYLGAQNVSTSSRIIINWHSDADYNYLIGKRAGAWTQPMDITFYTGIRYHAHQTYNAHIFYVTGYDSGEAFSIGKGDGHVRVVNNLYAPIFYDSNNTAYYVDPASTSNLNALTVAGGNATIYRDLIVNGGGSGNFGNRIIVQGTATTYTYQDTTLRPTVYLNGAYPVVTLNATESTNTLHGPTLQFAFNGLTTGGTTSRQIVIGAPGTGSWLDFGFSGGANGDNSSYNPHNGIGGYNGVTAMRLFSNGLLLGSTGAYPSAITSTSFALDVRGTGSSNTDFRAPIFYDSANTAYYLDPAGTSNLNALVLAGSSYFRPQTWIQMDGSYGMYWPNTNGCHIEGNTLSSYGSLAIRGTRGGWKGIHFYEGGNTPHLMFDGSANGGVYFETGARWGSYYSHGNNCWGFGTSATNSAYNLYAPTGVYSGGRVDGTIFYDSNNTTYYVDPSSTGYSAYFAGAIQATKIGIEDGGLDCYMEITDANPTVYGVGYGGEFIFYGDKSTPASFLYYGGATVTYTLQANSSLRSPIFYDSNDTSYYLDLNSSGSLIRGRVNITGGHGGSSLRVFLSAADNGATTGITTLQQWCSEPGNTWDGAGFGYNVDNSINEAGNVPVYYFGRPNTSFGQAYMRMTTDGNWYFYNTPNGSNTRYTTMVLERTGYVIASNSIRSPIFHDSDNTAYYTDPASTSNLLGLTVTNTITGNISGTAGSISGFNNPTTAATANTIVYRDGSGHITGNYIFGSYLNSTDDINTGTITHIMAKFGDNYHRSATAAKVAAFISGQTMNIAGSSTSCSGNAANVTGTVAIANGGTGATTLAAAKANLGITTAETSLTQSLSGTTGCTIDVAAASVHILTLSSGTVISSFTYNNRKASPSVDTLLVVLKFAGSATITWSNVVWASGITPTLTGANGKADAYMLTSYKGGATGPAWIGTVVSQNLDSTNL